MQTADQTCAHAVPANTPATVMLPCPKCRKLTHSLKRYRVYQFVLFLLIGGGARAATYTMCPSCMRGTLIKLTLINMIPGNLVWLFVVLPLHFVNFCRSFTRGASKSILAELR